MNSTRRITASLVAFLFTVLGSSECLSFPLVGNISAGFGEKWRSEPSFPRVSTRWAPEPIVNVIAGRRGLPIMLEGYGSGTRRDGHSDKTNDDVLRETRIEAGLGLAGILRLGPTYWHAGGGVARIASKTKSLYTDSPEVSFTEAGHWIGGGAFLPLGAGFDLGAALRYSSVDHPIDTRHSMELGGVSVSALIGWGWR